MKRFFDLPVFFMISLVFWATMAIAKDYVIYSIAQDFPMGNKDEILHKNFYVDIGKNQGVNNGTVLDVFRSLSVLDPYENKKRFTHKIKIGEIKVIQSEDLSSIGIFHPPVQKDGQIEAPVLDVSSLMIGDIVKVHVQ